MNLLKQAEGTFNKHKTLFLVAALVAVVIIVVTVGKELLSWINGKLTTAGAAVVNSGNKALGNIGNQDTDQATAPIESVGNYYSGISTNSADPFNPALYTSNAAASNLTFDILHSVADAVNASLMHGFLGIITSNGSAIALKAALQPCITQTDVSNVCIVYKQFYSSDMAAAIMRDYTTSLCNLYPDTDGNDNVTNLWSCIQWVNSLPKS